MGKERQEIFDLTCFSIGGRRRQRRVEGGAVGGGREDAEYGSVQNRRV